MHDTRVSPLISESKSVSLNPKENHDFVFRARLSATPLEIGIFIKVCPISRNLWNPWNTRRRGPSFYVTRDGRFASVGLWIKTRIDRGRVRRR